MLHIAVLRERKDNQNEQDILAGANDLRIGESLLGIEDEGADSAERSEVGQHGAGNVGAAVKPAVEPPGEKERADAAGDQHEEKAEKRDGQQAP